MTTSQNNRRDDQSFYAAFKGVDLYKEETEEVQDRFDKVQQRAQAKLRGVSEEDIERATDGDIFGLEFEVEE